MSGRGGGGREWVQSVARAHEQLPSSDSDLRVAAVLQHSASPCQSDLSRERVTRPPGDYGKSNGAVGDGVMSLGCFLPD